MIPEFSESTFANAFSNEVQSKLLRSGRMLLSAPMIPSLQLEAQLGFDVKFELSNLTVALQYKLGELITRYHSESPTWNHAGGPHFRIEFTEAHHQLGVLQQLEAGFIGSRTPAIVRYVAPMFTSNTELSACYQHSQVMSKSYGCRPSDIPADQERHHFFVGTQNGRAGVCSDFKPVEKFEVGAELSNALELAEPLNDLEGRDYIERVTSTLIAKSDLNGAEVEAMRERHIDAFPKSPGLSGIALALEVGQLCGANISFAARRIR